MNTFITFFQASAGVCTAIILICFAAMVLIDIYNEVRWWIDGEDDTEDYEEDDDNDRMD